VREIGHPLLVHKLSRIRDITTSKRDLTCLLKDIARFMVYEMLSDAEVLDREIQTWIGKRRFPFLEEKETVFVSILRAGIPMLEGAMDVLPEADAGFVAIKRDEETLESHLFYSRIPEVRGRRVVILDPMLATGGTLVTALREVRKGNPAQTVSFHIVCAPEGLERVRKHFPDHAVFTVSVDEGLDSNGYIIPGLGDMGDRLYSTGRP